MSRKSLATFKWEKSQTGLITAEESDIVVIFYKIAAGFDHYFICAQQKWSSTLLDNGHRSVDTFVEKKTKKWIRLTMVHTHWLMCIVIISDSI